MSAAAIRVTALAATAVKGLRLVSHASLVLDAGGARDNRRFYLVDERGRMVNGKQLGALTAVVADYRHDERRLTLAFPGDERVAAVVEPGEPIETRWRSRRVTARLVPGPWSQALSEHAGRPLRLVESAGHGGVDRGRKGAVSLVSRASLGALARAAGEPEVDGRRFRMLIEVDGVAAHEEDGWIGARLRIGTALVRWRGHVGRCIVTTRHPESGRVDLPTLDVLRSYRGDATSTEPLAFGVYGEVLEPGRVSVGDAVRVAGDASFT